MNHGTDNPISKIETHIPGLDDITCGGLPEGRMTLIVGSSGSGKTIFAVQFLAEAMARGESTVFVTFEEPPSDIKRNVLSLGWDLEQLERDGKLAFVDASPEPSQDVPVSGDHDLEALLSLIAHTVDKVGATRVAVDSLGSAFSHLTEASAVRAELRRVAAALGSMQVTTLLTAERVDEYGGISRFGVEEFVADNVIILRNVLDDEQRRRTVEVLKLRGAAHLKGEYPFTIVADSGVHVVPLSPSVSPAPSPTSTSTIEPPYVTGIGDGREVDDLRRRLRRAALEYEDLSSLLQSVMADNADGIMILSSTGDILMANPAAGTLFGRDARALVGEPFGAPISHSSGVTLLDVQSRSGSMIVEMRINTSVWSAEPVTVVTLRDISERHEAEQALRAFVSTASHELKTPLTTMVGFTSTMRSHWHELDDDRKLSYLEIIEQQADRLGRLADDLLRTARFDAGAYELDLRPLDVELVLRHAALVSPVEFETRLLCPPGTRFWADTDRLEELLINYLSNADKYGAPPIVVEVTTNDGFVEVAVVDHGEGVSPSFQPHLFTRFARDTQGSVREKPGSGLGLSIVRSVARALGGEAYHRHNPGGGARFVFTVPEATPERIASADREN